MGDRNEGRLGKWPEAAAFLMVLPDQLKNERFLDLPITLMHARHVGEMVTAHKDPFDRMLVAQAELEQLALVSAGHELECFGTKLLW